MLAARPVEQHQLPRWRILIAIPPSGFDGQFAVMRDWLDAVCGPHGWSAAPAGFSGVVNHAVAFYFADRGFARAFVERFACGYRAQASLGV